MVQHAFKISALAAAFALFSASHAGGAETPAAGARHYVPGEKLDSGLGGLPHYRDWAKHPETRKLVQRVSLASSDQRDVPGEKLDSGLGELPHYRDWAKHPQTRTLVQRADPAGGQQRVLGEKLDSGLGELPHYRDWAKHPQTRALVRRADPAGGDRLDNGQGRNLSNVSSTQVDRLGVTSY